MLIEEIDETQYEEKVLKSNNIVLIYFYAEWVELCKILVFKYKYCYI